jgi:hypothetical protein
VYWEGTLAADEAGVDWRPAAGRIVVAEWPLAATAGSAAGPSASQAGAGPTNAAPTNAARASAAATRLAPRSSPSPTRPAAPTSGKASVPPSSGAPSPGTASLQGLINGPLADFDAQFDPTGQFLAVWIANPTDPSAGFLTLYAIDQAGRVDPAHGPLVALPALRGFSIGAGRLAWVSPPDPSGSGSRIHIVGWTGGGFGTVESMPAERLLVIR